jgi:chemotaxis-related protein WspB
MLVVTLQAHGSLYAVEAARIIEVAPRVELRPVPHAPAYLAGLLHYRGRVLPAIDLSLLLGGERSADRLSTRIVVLDRPGEVRGQPSLGLIAEHVSDVRNVPEDAEALPALPLPEAPYLGPIFQVGEDLLQLIFVDSLLSEPLRAALFEGRSGPLASPR